VLAREDVMKTLRRSVLAVLLAAAVVFPAVARAAVVWTETIPVDFVGFVSCANDGAGEEVHITGAIRTFATTTVTPGGAFSNVYHGNYQGVSGVGLTTGDRYQAVGVFTFTINATSAPQVFTGMSAFMMLGQGPNNNFKSSGNVHVTVIPDGTTRSSVDHFTNTCG
jgi:hypothetical protein